MFDARDGFWVFGGFLRESFVVMGWFFLECDMEYVRLVVKMTRFFLELNFFVYANYEVVDALYGSIMRFC